MRLSDSMGRDVQLQVEDHYYRTYLVQPAGRFALLPTVSTPCQFRLVCRLHIYQIEQVHLESVSKDSGKPFSRPNFPFR